MFFVGESVSQTIWVSHGLQKHDKPNNQSFKNKIENVQYLHLNLPLN